MSEKPANPNLIPFTGGFDARRARGKGRPAFLDSQEKIDLFAEAVGSGMLVKEIMETFSISKSTVAASKKDPRVKVAALKYIEERVIRISRKVDSTIEARLLDPEELDTETLLRIRKEYLGGAFRAQTTGDSKDDRTINEAMDELEKNPGMAEALDAILSGKAAPVVAE